jgi:hypothetical protein
VAVAKRPSPGSSVPRTLVINAVTGAVVGLAVLALLLVLDPLGLRPLLARDEQGPLLLVIMALQFAAGFAAFAAATGLFLLDRDPDGR